MKKCARFLVPSPLSAFIAAVFIVTADAQHASTMSSKASHSTTEPNSMPPSMYLGFLLCCIQWQTFQDACSV